MWTLPLGGGDIKQYRRRQWHSPHPPRGQAPVKDGHLYGCWCQEDFATGMALTSAACPLSSWRNQSVPIVVHIGYGVSGDSTYVSGAHQESRVHRNCRTVACPRNRC